MGTQSHSRKYLESQIKTASKEQLLLMLYDGAIQNCLNAQEFIANKDHEKACEKLIKAQNIVAELISSLQFDKNQEVSKNLAALYGYVYIQLMEANVKHSAVAVQNSLKILSSLKDTWVQAFEKVGLTKEAVPSDSPSLSANSAPLVQSGLSVQA